MKIFLLFFAVLLGFATFMPSLDIAAAGWFYDAARGGFWLRENMVANAMHETVQWGARVLAVIALITALNVRYRKAALFLFITLVIGPGILTNTVLKDNWGRARPVQVQEFGGSAIFTPALQPANQCEKNCSFVSGDGALGFYLHTLFYVVPPRLRRRVFAVGFFGGGILFGGLRIAMGAHFLSDVLWAGLAMLFSSAALHAVMYGRDKTYDAWQSVIGKNA